MNANPATGHEYVRDAREVLQNQRLEYLIDQHSLRNSANGHTWFKEKKKNLSLVIKNPNSEDWRSIQSQKNIKVKSIPQAANASFYIAII